MKRILRHVGAKDFRQTRQRKLDEQRILSEKIRRKEIREQREKEIAHKYLNKVLDKIEEYRA